MLRITLLTDISFTLSTIIIIIYRCMHLKLLLRSEPLNCVAVEMSKQSLQRVSTAIQIASTYGISVLQYVSMDNNMPHSKGTRVSPILLRWVSNHPVNVGWNYRFISKFQLLHRWSWGMDKWLNSKTFLFQASQTRRVGGFALEELLDMIILLGKIDSRDVFSVVSGVDSPLVAALGSVK